MSNGQNGQVITLERVRFSYLYGYRPYVSPPDPKTGKVNSTYCCHAIMAPDHPGIAIVKAAQRAVALATWGPQNGEVIYQQLGAQDRLALHSGDRNKPGEDAYKGKFFVSANNKARPRIVVTQGGVNVETNEDHPYAVYPGCIGNMLVQIWAQSNQFGKRVNASLMGLQFVEHAERLGGQRIAKLEEFGVVDVVAADAAMPMAGAPAAVGASPALPGSDLC